MRSWRPPGAHSSEKRNVMQPGARAAQDGANALAGGQKSRKSRSLRVKHWQQKDEAKKEGKKDKKVGEKQWRCGGCRGGHGQCNEQAQAKKKGIKKVDV